MKFYSREEERQREEEDPDGIKYISIRTITGYPGNTKNKKTRKSYKKKKKGD